MIVSLREWLQNGWLVEHAAGRDEIHGLLQIADRDLHGCAEVSSADWKMSIAYNAALQLANAALAAAGYRAAQAGHHYHTIQSLALTIGWKASDVSEFERFRKKRNVSNYERAFITSELEAKRMIEIAKRLRREVETWIRAKHPSLL